MLVGVAELLSVQRSPAQNTVQKTQLHNISHLALVSMGQNPLRGHHASNTGTRLGVTSAFSCALRKSVRDFGKAFPERLRADTSCSIHFAVNAVGPKSFGVLQKLSTVIGRSGREVEGTNRVAEDIILFVQSRVGLSIIKVVETRHGHWEDLIVSRS